MPLGISNKARNIAPSATLAMDAKAKAMPIIKRWLYSDKDIFIREVVSNGCDAIVKQKMSHPDTTDDYRVLVTLDEAAGEIRFDDNGIGMEMPLTRVLFGMEREGFSVDRSALKELGVLFSSEMEQCREKVITLTGGVEFNVNSPKQLGEVLFDRLKLPSPTRKSKAGAWSTSADVLEALDHPAIEPLLQYRKLAKLMGTYIEGLSRLVDATGRIHTTFDQTSTVTGRISSVDPNLQNIPVRSEEGREIRRAFVAREGCVLLDADYSQIELRVLAHLSGDPAMAQDACA